MQIRELESIQNYKEFLLKVGNLVNELVNQYQEEINCKINCCDCCNNLINISIIEASYLRMGFDISSDEIKNKILENISNLNDLIEHESLPKTNIVCPLLFKQKCLLYEYRPVVCRTFGLPMIDEKTGKIATCHKNFVSLRDKEMTLNSVSTKQISTQTVVLSQYLLYEIGKQPDKNYIPPLYSLLEIFLPYIQNKT